MHEATSVSLLEQLRHDADSPSWHDFVELYSGLIGKWLRQRGVAPADADDIQQEVLAVVVRELPRFEHSGRTGAFRHWLRNVTANRAREFWRARDRQKAVPAGSRIGWIADQLADPLSPLSAAWDLEHDRYVLDHMLANLAGKFTAKSLAAFRRVVLQDEDAGAVADDLGMSVNAVRIAQSRVMRALRESSSGLVD